MKERLQLNYSELDSKRFGMNIFRAVVSSINTGELRDEMEKNEVDILILRMPVTSKPVQHELLNLQMPFIHADTLVHYELDLKKHNAQELKNPLVIKEITSTDESALSEMIPLIFKGYKNHYFSNPLLDRKKLSEGYLEWGRAYVGHSSEGKISFLAKSNDVPVAFANCAFDKDSGFCEGILFGVHPEHEGTGIYSDLIRFTAGYFKSAGYQTMDVSTQIQNFAVQKAWTRQGFFLHKAFDTYHINALLKSGKEFIVSKQMV